MKKKPHEVDLLSDTSRDAELVQLEILRKKTPGERLELADNLSATVRAFMMGGIALRHPDLTEGQRHRKLMDLLLGEPLAETVYGKADYSCRRSTEEIEHDG